MGRTFRAYLAGETLYSCRQCNNHLAVSEGVISKNFHGQFGRALLVHHLVNIYNGEPETRDMRTGAHIVRDTFCAVCHQLVGWKYQDQKYKEKHYILERERINELPESQVLDGSKRTHIRELPLHSGMDAVLSG